MNTLFTPMIDVDNLPVDDMLVERYANRLDVTWGSHKAQFNDEKHLMSFFYNISRSVHVNVNIIDRNQKIDFSLVTHKLVYSLDEETKETSSPVREGNPRRKLGKSDKNRIRDARSRRKAKKKAKTAGATA